MIEPNTVTSYQQPIVPGWSSGSYVKHHDAWPTSIALLALSTWHLQIFRFINFVRCPLTALAFFPSNKVQYCFSSRDFSYHVIDCDQWVALLPDGLSNDDRANYTQSTVGIYTWSRTRRDYMIITHYIWQIFFIAWGGGGGSGHCWEIVRPCVGLTFSLFALFRLSWWYAVTSKWLGYIDSYRNRCTLYQDILKRNNIIPKRKQ